MLIKSIQKFKKSNFLLQTVKADLELDIIYPSCSHIGAASPELIAGRKKSTSIAQKELIICDTNSGRCQQVQLTSAVVNLDFDKFSCRRLITRTLDGVLSFCPVTGRRTILF